MRMILSILVLAVLAIGFQGCLKAEWQPVANVSGGASVGLDEVGSGSENEDKKEDGEGNGGDNLSKANLKSELERNLVQNCTADSEYNACIFWKNPVAQQGQAFTTAINRNSDLKNVQIHAVNIEGYDDSGVLKNSSFFVRALTASGQLQSVSTESGQFKFSFRGDALHRVGQVMAFYWLTLQEKYMSVVTGAFFAAKKGISVISYVPDLENAYWDSDLQEVVLGSSTVGNEFALGAEVYLHEMGHANVAYATNYKINESVGSFSSISCGGGQAVCCANANGCSWAINEGQADYHAGILFSASTTFLETFVNNTSGLSECGLSRSLDANKNLTAQAAYNACNVNVRGEVHVTGRVYASVWWEVRKLAEKNSPEVGADEIDVLFTNHLVTLEARDTFVTALDKIQAVDQTLYKGKYSNSFKDEFSKRGIQ